MRVIRPSLLLLLPITILASEGAEPDAGAAEAMPAAESEAPAMDTAAAEEQLARLRDQWVQAAEAADGARVAELYADDAVFVGADGERLDGPAAIEQSLGARLQGMTAMDVRSLSVVSGPRLIADMGRYVQTFQGEGGEQQMSGFYLIVAERQQDGGWKIAQHLAAPPGSGSAR